MDNPFPPQGNLGVSHPGYHADPYQPMRPSRPMDQWQWQGSHPYNSPSQPSAMLPPPIPPPPMPPPLPPYSSYHPSASGWYQGYPPMDDYHGPGQSRYPMEGPGYEGDHRRPLGSSSRGRSRSRGRSQYPTEEEARLGHQSGQSEASGRSSSRSKRSLAKSVYVDDMLAPKEPGTRPLSLRELADFDYNEKGRMVVKEHSTYGQPASNFLPRQSRSRSSSPALAATAAPGDNETDRDHDSREPEAEPSSSSSHMPPAISSSPSLPAPIAEPQSSVVDELKSEIARLRAELQAQQEETRRRYSEESKALRAELEKLQAKNEELSVRETKSAQPVALKEEELDLVRLRLEKIAQQMTEIRLNQCSRPRSERRSSTRSQSQGSVPVSGRGRRTPPKRGLLTAGPSDSLVDPWMQTDPGLTVVRSGPGGSYHGWEAPAEGTLLYRTIDENGHEVEYREVAVIRHAPGERKVVSETYVEPSGAMPRYSLPQKVKTLDLKPLHDVKKGDHRKGTEGKGLPEGKSPVLVGKDYFPDDDAMDDWEMPITPTKPTSQSRAWHHDVPVKAQEGPASRSRSGNPKSRASGDGPSRARNTSRGHGTKKKSTS